MKALVANILLGFRQGGTQQDDSLLSPVKFLEYDRNKREITLAVPSTFYRDQFLKRYCGPFQDKLEQKGWGRPNVVCRIQPEIFEQTEFPDFLPPKEPSAPEKKPRARIYASRPLNEKLTFDRFITGPSNQFAASYSQSVADKPGGAFNPLFIYGGSGLGKTHLLNAVALHIRDRFPRLRITYQTAEEFTNRMISHIQRKKDANFREAYRRNCDVLLIDDIQFIAGKERTTEEFFHIFNALYEAGKQIVLTADLYPRDIPELPERMRSRFAVGLIADIQPPELETRIAILKEKADTEGVVLPEDVLYFVATACTDHVRQLEGALMQLKAYSSVVGKRITLDSARSILRNTISSDDRAITVEGILKAVAGMYSVKISDLKGPRRHKALADPRQQAMYLARKLTGMSYPEIGKKFGGKDHSTVIHAEKKIKRRMEDEPELRKAIGTLENLSRDKS